MIGVFWQGWDALGGARDPFNLYPMLGNDLLDAMERVGVRRPDQALEEMQHRGLIYAVKEGEFRLVYPRMVEQYASAVSPEDGLTLKEINALLPNSGRRCEMEKLDVLRHVAEEHEAELVAGISVSAFYGVEARAQQRLVGACTSPVTTKEVVRTHMNVWSVERWTESFDVCACARWRNCDI